MGFRPNLYVVARFLDRLHDGPKSRSALQRACRVNYDIFRTYLEVLVTRGLATEDDDVVGLTAAGIDMRKRLRTVLTEFLDDAPDPGAGTPARPADPSPV